jgi:hypothetical protein
LRRSHFMPEWVWTVILLILLPCVARMTEAFHCSQSFVEMQSCILFFFLYNWLSTVILLISAFQATRIAGLGHQAQPQVLFQHLSL